MASMSRPEYDQLSKASSDTVEALQFGLQSLVDSSWEKPGTFAPNRC